MCSVLYRCNRTTTRFVLLSSTGSGDRDRFGSARRLRRLGNLSRFSELLSQLLELVKRLVRRCFLMHDRTNCLDHGDRGHHVGKCFRPTSMPAAPWSSPDMPGPALPVQVASSEVARVLARLEPLPRFS